MKVRRSTKLAVTVLSASMVTMHDLVPEHAPVQLEKAYTEVPVAVTVTWTPGSWVVVPGGVRVPPADGLAVVVRDVVWEGAWTKLAVTVLSASMVTTHGPVPEHAPVQLSKAYPDSAVAVTVTSTPALWVIVPEGDRVPPVDGLAVVVRT